MSDDALEPYAQAIVSIATGENALDVVDDELLRIAHAVRDDRDLHEVLTNRQFAVGRRLEAVEEILEAAHPATRTAVALLVSSGTVRRLEAVANRVAELAAAERERDLAEIHVAVPLDDDQRDSLRRGLERATGKQLELQVFVDPSVVGGVRAKVGDTVIDGSVARRLEDVRARLSA